jgi:hypothetical protein
VPWKRRGRFAASISRRGAMSSTSSPRARATILDRWFESDADQGRVRLRRGGRQLPEPVRAGSAYVLLHHVFGEVNGKRGQWGHARGGMGAITQAMARECARAASWSAPARRSRGVIVKRGARRALRWLRATSSREARDRQRQSALLFERLVDPACSTPTSARASRAIAAARARSA